MLFDTNFLIHLAGQRGRRPQSVAKHFMQRHLDEPLYISRVAWAEFAEGCGTRDEVADLLAEFEIIEINEAVAWAASRLSRDLARRGLPIGDNDVWIAATAIVYRLPLVSRNARHFDRVPGLSIKEY